MNRSAIKFVRKLVVGTLVISGALTLQPSSLAQNHSAAPAHHVGIEGEHFMLDGQPLQIISGEIHYPRIPREYWRDRLRRARAM